jgi:hypothetical protein
MTSETIIEIKACGCDETCCEDGEPEDGCCDDACCSVSTASEQPALACC